MRRRAKEILFDLAARCYLGACASSGTILASWVVGIEGPIGGYVAAAVFLGAATIVRGNE